MKREPKPKPVLSRTAWKHIWRDLNRYAGGWVLTDGEVRKLEELVNAAILAVTGGKK